MRLRDFIPAARVLSRSKVEPDHVRFSKCCAAVRVAQSILFSHIPRKIRKVAVCAELTPKNVQVWFQVMSIASTRALRSSSTELSVSEWYPIQYVHPRACTVFAQSGGRSLALFLAISLRLRSRNSGGFPIYLPSWRSSLNRRWTSASLL